MTSSYEVVSDAAGAFEFCNRFYLLANTKHQKGIVLKRNGEIIAACVYDEFNGTNIFMHCAGMPGTRFVTREFLKWAYHYPFVQLGCKRITGVIDADNKVARRFAEHIGWTLEAVLEGASRSGGDVCIYRYKKEDCKYV